MILSLDGPDVMKVCMCPMERKIRCSVLLVSSCIVPRREGGHRLALVQKMLAHFLKTKLR